MSQRPNLRTRIRGIGRESGLETHSSRTLTLTQSNNQVEEDEPIMLSLQPTTSQNQEQGLEQEGEAGPRVRFSSDVVDNEHLNKKKSKICCIYRKQFKFGESSEEETSSEEDEENKNLYQGKDIGSPNAYERQPKYKNNKHKGCNH